MHKTHRPKLKNYKEDTPTTPPTTTTPTTTTTTITTTTTNNNNNNNNNTNNNQQQQQQHQQQQQQHQQQPQPQYNTHNSLSSRVFSLQDRHRVRLHKKTDLRASVTCLGSRAVEVCLATIPLPRPSELQSRALHSRTRFGIARVSDAFGFIRMHPFDCTSVVHRNVDCC